MSNPLNISQGDINIQFNDSFDSHDLNIFDENVKKSIYNKTQKVELLISNNKLNNLKTCSQKQLEFIGSIADDVDLPVINDVEVVLSQRSLAELIEAQKLLYQLKNSDEENLEKPLSELSNNEKAVLSGCYAIISLSQMRMLRSEEKWNIVFAMLVWQEFPIAMGTMVSLQIIIAYLVAFSTNPGEVTALTISSASVFAGVKLLSNIQTFTNCPSAFSAFVGLKLYYHGWNSLFWVSFLRKLSFVGAGFLGLVGGIGDSEIVFNAAVLNDVCSCFLIQCAAILCGVRSGSAVNAIQTFVGFEFLARFDNILLEKLGRDLKYKHAIKFLELKFRPDKDRERSNAIMSAVITISTSILGLVLLFVMIYDVTFQSGYFEYQIPPSTRNDRF